MEDLARELFADIRSRKLCNSFGWWDHVNGTADGVEYIVKCELA